MYFSMWNKGLLYYTNRSRYCKRHRPPLRNKYRTWKYTYWYYRTVNYCLFCYFVFWIPTIEDTIFIFQQKQYNSDKRYYWPFSKMFPQKEKKHSNRVHVEQNTVTIGFDRASSGLTVTCFSTFFSITTLQREAVTNCTLGLVSATKTLGICT